MKLYRIQAKYKGIYINEMLESENDTAALDCFVKKVESGEVKLNDNDGFYDPNRMFITFEEVDRDATINVDIGKTSTRVSMGSAGVSPKESND